MTSDKLKTNMTLILMLLGRISRTKNNRKGRINRHSLMKILSTIKLHLMKVSKRLLERGRTEKPSGWPSS